MKRDTAQLQTEQFDIVIVGGGITGACLAFDASLRGMSVAVVEKNDFGAATSAASSKLLHGGIRYLQQGRLAKVRESAFERAYFQNIAPHLTQYVPFVIPTYVGFRKGKFLLNLGMRIYEVLCKGQNRHIIDRSKKVPPFQSISRQALHNLIPELCLDRITGGVLLYESHMHSSERMTLGFLQSAASRGAVIANYVKADSFLMDSSKVIGVKAKDLIERRELEIYGSLTVNAAGPWIPNINQQIRKKKQSNLITSYSKGVHIVTPPITKEHAVALPTKFKNQGVITRGGRHIFIIPWRGCSLIGTTYTPFNGILDEVWVEERDVLDLVDNVNSAFGTNILGLNDVLHSYSGLYPLIDDRINAAVYQGTGDYQIIDHRREDGIKGLVTVFGAKYTTARLLAERALNLVAGKLERSFKPCQTKRTPLRSGEISDIEDFCAKKKSEYRSHLQENVIDHLITNYGNEIDSILEYVRKEPELGSRLSSNQHIIEAEIRYSIRHEMAQHLDDFVFRRTGLGTLGNPGGRTLRRCAEFMGKELGWNRKRIDWEMHRTEGCFLEYGYESHGSKPDGQYRQAKQV